MKYVLAFTAAVISGLAGYAVYTETSILSAVIVVFFGAIAAHGLRSKAVSWGTLKLLQQPHILALVAIIFAFFYVSLDGFSFWPATYLSTAAAMIGFAMGIVIYSLWNLR